MNKALLPILGFICSQFFGQAPPTQNPAEKPTIGLYRNFSYGFTTVIPKGLEAWWNSGPMWYDEGRKEWIAFADHGRTIPLGNGAYIEIFAAFNSTESTLQDLLYEDIKTFRGNSDSVDFHISSLGPFDFKKYKALHFRARKEIGASVVVREAVVALTPDRSIEYNISIECPEEMFQTQRKAFLAIINSWFPSPRE